MGVKNYFPDRGDVVWTNFNPTRGHEQKGRRPALVLSPKTFNTAVGNIICCPVSSKLKGYKFEVEIEVDGKKGVVQADQIRTLDWRERKIEYDYTVDSMVVRQVQARIIALITQ
jgi:mRNA interferase MazF